MNTISIYDPRIKAYAERHGITDLQAYRALNAREVLRRRVAEQKQVAMDVMRRVAFK